MLNSFLWGLLATSSLILGGVIASFFPLSKRTIGIILGFGAGTLISAVSYELVFEAVNLAGGTGFTAYGFFAGAATFYFADQFIGKIGAGGRMNPERSVASKLIVPMVLGIVLDGIPESLVIGLGLVEDGSVSVAMLVAVFISNMPESIAGTSGMMAGGWNKRKINLVWVVIAVMCALATVAGSSLFTGASDQWLAFIQAFAGGAILMMLANSMIPEAYEHGGKLSGVFTVLGFFISVTIIILERS